jgi:hypothetical protein
MKATYIALAFLAISLAPAQLWAGDTTNKAPGCSRMCDPAKSKPCGMSCISKEFTCHKPVATACVKK